MVVGAAREAFRHNRLTSPSGEPVHHSTRDAVVGAAGGVWPPMGTVRLGTSLAAAGATRQEAHQYE